MGNAALYSHDEWSDATTDAIVTKAGNHKFLTTYQQQACHILINPSKQLCSQVLKWVV